MNGAPQVTFAGPEPAEPQGRYHRLEQIPWWRQERLAAARILVAGAGALGNEILKNLALLGVGRIVIVDLDVIEASNLSRSVLFRAADEGKPKAQTAARRLRRINPHVKVFALHGDLRWHLGLGLLKRMDMVLAGLDSIGARLALNQMCWQAGVPWLDGGLDALNGTLRVYSPPREACFECGLSNRDYQRLSASYSCQLLPREAAEGGWIATTPTSASLIAAWQVQEAVKSLHGRPLAASSSAVFDGVGFELRRVRLRRRPGCPAHETLGEVLRLPGITADVTVAELLDLLEDRCGEPVSIELDREVVVGASCPACGGSALTPQALFTLPADGNRCASCGAETNLHLCHRLAPGSELGPSSLRQLGVPPLHILTARAADGRRWSFELTGDAKAGKLGRFLKGVPDERP